LFCGGGGLSQGLTDSGIEIIAALDNWPAAIAFYSRNITGHPAKPLDLSDVEKTVGIIRVLSPDLIVGGPPCQDFSSAGKRIETGERANLTISFASIVCEVKPMAFIMENVDRAQKTRTFKQALEMFKHSGYGITETVLDASLCGVPQKRKRVIVFGVLGAKNNTIIPIIIKKQSKKPMTVRDCLGDSLGIDHYYRHPRSYARRGIFSIDEPSPTVRGVNRPLPQGYPGHPGDTADKGSHIRPLTTKERSLIQTFPETWDVSGNKSDVEQIIGNAVPVKLGEFVGQCLLEFLSNRQQYEYAELDNKGECVLFEQKRAYRASGMSA
ncbi:MAG: DNA (cytosine-5-)-methyltransferase, partial [Victivallales bacterium]|nr:DNA (cytosine-5-)-methyltransferase [Victivallales bacterium]